jgi:ABC-type glycerol-3-phosphate transport system substrate-binding protein
MKLTTLALAITLVLSGCGFAAKNLAKQVSDLTKKTANIEKQAADIEEKVAKLSARDRRTYQEELARLGFEPPEWLFSDAEALASGAEYDTDDTPGGIFGGLARMVGGLFGGNSGGGARGGIFSGGKPTPLPANATHRQAMAKYDELVAYVVKNPPSGITAGEIEEMKTALNLFRGQLQLLSLAWSDREVRDGIVETINGMISELE